MEQLLDLLGDVIDQASERCSASKWSREGDGHDCDGCGVEAADVDLWAEDPETGEELWLCLACGDW